MWRYRRVFPPRNTIPITEVHSTCPLQWLQLNTTNIKDNKCAKFKFQKYMSMYEYLACEIDVTFFRNCARWNDKGACWDMYQRWVSNHVEVS